MNYDIRTDIALESKEIYQKARNIEEEISGVETIIDDSSPNLLITKVNILTKEGETALNKPIGTYITIESPHLNDEVSSINEEIVKKTSQLIQEIAHLVKKDTVLVVGLGNIDVTPDALGPRVVENLQITRHLIEYAPEYIPKGTRAVSAIIPGVLGTTGIETSEIVKGIVEKIHPNLVIVIDALASKNMDRISRTIQIADTGIIPGSGVGNSRFAITKETLGIPVIAIGIPTVVGVPTIVDEAIHYVIEKSENPTQKESIQNSNYRKEILENKKFDFMVTPKDIDEMIENLSDILASSINMALN